MGEASEALRAVRDELLAQGLTEGLDFAVLGTGDPSAFSSELIVLWGDERGWHVDYRDMGRSRELLCSEDLPSAHERFVDEALELAAGRGRGPRAVERTPTISLAELREQRRRGDTA